MSSEPASPFTIPEPAFVFSEGPSTEALPNRPLTFQLLIQNLRSFAAFYEESTRLIEAAKGFEKPYYVGGRDANANDLRDSFMAVQDIDRIRTLTLSMFGEDLTISSAQRLLGELLRSGNATTEQALNMVLGEVADRVEGSKGKGAVPAKCRPANAHSPDFSSVRIGTSVYTFTPKQRAVIAALWGAWDQGTPWLSQAHLQEAAETDSRIVDLFKDSPAWGKLIVKDEKVKDLFSLSIPKLGQ